MPARRCSACNETWPQAFDFNRCPRCEGQTVYDAQLESPYTFDEAFALKSLAGQIPVGTQTTTGDVVRAHRLERFLALGFNEFNANLLTDATFAVSVRPGGPRYPFPLDWHRVDRALKSGWDHAQCMEVFA